MKKNKLKSILALALILSLLLSMLAGCAEQPENPEGENESQSKY